MTKLTGFTRLLITKAWMKSDKALSQEEFIKKVCQAKDIEYRQPTPIDRPLRKTITPSSYEQQLTLT